MTEIGLLGPQSIRLLIGVGVFLVVATVVAEIMFRRATTEGLRNTLTNVRQRIFAWWIMVGVLVVSLALGETVLLVLFMLLSLVALREFTALVPAGEKDGRALIWIMAVLTPLHYWFMWARRAIPQPLNHHWHVWSCKKAAYRERSRYADSCF